MLAKYDPISGILTTTAPVDEELRSQIDPDDLLIEAVSVEKPKPRDVQTAVDAYIMSGLNREEAVEKVKTVLGLTTLEVTPLGIVKPNPQMEKPKPPAPPPPPEGQRPEPPEEPEPDEEE